MQTKSIKLPWLLLFLVIILLNSGCVASNRAAAKKSNTVIQTARTYTGVPYKFGGTTRVGMDCSALLLHSFKSVKVKLPRVSEDQAKVGEKVKLKELKPGDMLFFATGKKKNKITHAGIVTSVKGKKEVRFIHASTSLGVTESNLYSDYYLKRFKRARRVL
jgi:cell wall-associated NlpC family hydrolase